MELQVYTFARIDDEPARLAIYQEIRNGKARFGMWEQNQSLRTEFYGKNAFLLRIRNNDWIVYINMPSYGKCVAMQTSGEYDFDEGISCAWGQDFRNFIPVDIKTIVEFNRNDPNILPSVNLSPMRRGQRILQVQDFLKSIDNLKEGRFSNFKSEERNLLHLKEKIKDLLPQITSKIHEMNKSKEFERFLHKIFESMPNTVSIQNGFGWKSDNGADLIVVFENPIIGINITTKLIVQAKSYEGQHFDKNAIDQIVQGINTYKADAGLLITTANSTEMLEKYVREKSEEIDKTIDVIAGSDVARFVLRYAPELLIGN